MSLLSIVNRAQAILNLPISSTVYSNTGQTQKQLLQLANIEGAELADEYAWQALIVEKNFTTVATEEQTLSDLPDDLGWIIDETLFNRDATVRIFGPLGSRAWQDQKAFGAGGADSQYRIRANEFWFMPAPTAGQAVYYEYVSNEWCQNISADTAAAWTADTDTARIPEHIMTLGLIWRWKQAKGLDFSQDYETYQAAKDRRAARDGTRRKLSVAGPSSRQWPGRGRIPEAFGT